MRGVGTSTNVPGPRLVRSVELTRPQVVGVMLLACFPLPLLSLGAMVVPLPEIIERAAAGFIPFASSDLKVETTRVARPSPGKRRTEAGVRRAAVRSVTTTPVARSSASTARAKEAAPTRPAARAAAEARTQPVTSGGASPGTTPAPTDAPKEPVTDPPLPANSAEAPPPPAETQKGHGSRGKPRDDRLPPDENGGGSHNSQDKTPETPAEPPGQSGDPGGGNGGGSGGNSGGGNGGNSGGGNGGNGRP